MWHVLSQCEELTTLKIKTSCYVYDIPPNAKFKNIKYLTMIISDMDNYPLFISSFPSLTHLTIRCIRNATTNALTGLKLKRLTLLCGWNNIDLPCLKDIQINHLVLKSGYKRTINLDLIMNISDIRTITLINLTPMHPFTHAHINLCLI